MSDVALIPLPRRRVLAFMASLLAVTGQNARLYLDELTMLLGRPFQGGD